MGRGGITNRNRPNSDRPKLEADIVCLHKPGNEGQWAYCHHPHLAYYRQQWYAMWSNSPLHEDDAGQRVLIASSRDFFHWTEPKPLVADPWGDYAMSVLTAGGFHVNGGTLVAYFGCYEYSPEQLENGSRKAGDQGHVNTRLYAMTSEDGTNWSEPMDLKLPLVPNHGPQRTSTGRLIISGNTMFPYTDDPSGLRGWIKTGIYTADEADAIADDSETIRAVQMRMGWPNLLCEGSFYETDDRVLHMLLRSNTGKLWVTQSANDGRDWSPPVPTEFTDNAAKFHFGRLADGRYYYVGCPDPEPLWRRNPLVLSLSADGISFDRHYILGDEKYEIQYPGMAKGGDYGYPHTLAVDDHLYVIYSTGKERIMVMRLSMEQLQA